MTDPVIAWVTAAANVAAGVALLCLNVPARYAGWASAARFTGLVCLASAGLVLARWIQGRRAERERLR